MQVCQHEKNEARRIANAHSINQFRVVFVTSEVRHKSATCYCSVCRVHNSIQNFKHLQADTTHMPNELVVTWLPSMARASETSDISFLKLRVVLQDITKLGVLLEY